MIQKNCDNQIYVSHQRLWLGTFSSELEAALAYDRACLKLRSAEGPRNILNGKQCHIENNFQELYTSGSDDIRSFLR